MPATGPPATASPAHDLGDSRPLAAVTDNGSQAKGDQDSPPDAALQFRPLPLHQRWAASKSRWQLTVDTTGKNAQTIWANFCPGVTVTVAPAI